MDKVKIEAFLSVPPCSGGVSLTKLLDEVEAEFGDRIEVIVHKGPQELAKEYNLTAAPALVIGAHPSPASSSASCAPTWPAGL